VPSIKLLNRIIEFSFYGIFFLVPLFFTNNTSELFEFNKLWLTFALTIIIGVAWALKMFSNGEFRIQRTPLDIPIVLFFLALVLSTIFSWDRHTSLWGYYSRFNGGLFSMASYIFLYYAFVSNLNDIKMVRRNILISIASGVIVALWGLPAHFGYDPTCKLFRGTLDVSCWTEDFQPKVRIFSTMGQPDWLGAYLALLIPMVVAFAMELNPFKKDRRELLKFIAFKVVFVLFFVDVLFTRSRSSILAVIASLILMLVLNHLRVDRKRVKDVLFFWRKDNSTRSLVAFVIGAIFLCFLIGVTFSKIEKYSLANLLSTNKTAAPQTTTPTFASELGGTDSGKIRLYVWEGAINAFVRNPLFGTGLETYAFSYYKYKPVGQNLTSEWNFLYNKAHNEFLNYLATTGIFGFASYIAMIGLFLFSFVLLSVNRQKKLFTAWYTKVSRVTLPKSAYEGALNPISIALVSAYAGILITNFFGFSVVMTNIYLFIIPAFLFIWLGIIDPKLELRRNIPFASTYIKNAFSLGAVLLGLFLLFRLYTIWVADTEYALGRNLDQVGQYQQAYSVLSSAVGRYNEPIYKDEYSVNQAVLGTSFAAQGSTESAQLTQSLSTQAIQISDQLTKDYPKNIVYWKSRVRIFYTLAQINPSYLKQALEAIKSAEELAPNDASISYNLGVLYGQTGDSNKAVTELERTISLRPDYQDARYALGIFYRELAVDANGNVLSEDYNKKAKEQMEYILTKITPDDSRAKDALTTWK
jgi:tetratricopeptide (TPR) repeat protein